ncbi:MAG: hypothetical protein KME30_15915 [Iphinoe sp. HA4291-MV1]|nr:hypothetical protein [Iphinoe sp. HA4291-MV1]
MNSDTPEPPKEYLFKKPRSKSARLACPLDIDALDAFAQGATPSPKGRRQGRTRSVSQTRANAQRLRQEKEEKRR